MASLKMSGMLCAVCWFHGLVRSQPSTSPLGGGSVDMNSVPQLAAKPWETLLDRCAAARPLVKGPSAGIFSRMLWVCDRGRGVVNTWGVVGAVVVVVLRMDAVAGQSYQPRQRQRQG